MKKSSEHLEQCAFFDWCRLHQNRYPCLEWIFAIPNGGLRNKRVAQKLKREGVKSGVHDVFLPYSFWGYLGLFMEFKYGNNKLTNSQKQFQEEMQKRGYKVSVVYSSEEAIETVKEYLNID